MPVKEIGDPRLQALFGISNAPDAGVRPIVRLRRRGFSPLAIGISAAVLALLLFVVLNERRTRQQEPQVQTQADGGADAWAAPPPLTVPLAPQPEEAAEPPLVVAPALLPVAPPAPAPTSRTVASPGPVARPVGSFLSMSDPRPSPAERVSSGSPLVIDTGGSAGPTAAPGEPAADPLERGSQQQGMRMRASAFANRSMTVPQGHMIPAVLETGFDSTKPGFARAVVSRDVRGFDGKYVLVPRGSRLIGEYRSTIALGQKRAIINWTRLIRPDGMTITIDSPAVDPLGRGGVAASVNTHFLARVGDALLQTAFGFGTGLVQRSVTGPVLVLPGSGGAAGQIASANNYVPTLKVAPGTSISVFVAHDLDFSAAGEGQ